MCNLYSVTTNQEAIRRLFRVGRDRTGNLPPLPGVFPDYEAPIVRTGADGERELVLARWGMPSPPQYGTYYVTNVRNTTSAHWKRWLDAPSRCLIPATSFCEYADTKPRKTPTWFAMDDSRPLFAFAGIWTRWTGTRGTKSKPIEGQHELFGFLTCAPNAVVSPIHPEAMPVILTTPDDFDTWLSAPWSEAARLQRPLPDDALRIVATRKGGSAAFNCTTGPAAMTPTSVPKPALILGWAGVIPFAALALASVVGLALPIAPIIALRAYGCAILSFMAGAQWGVTMRSTAFSEGWIGYAISVLPALVAWASLLTPIREGLVLQLVGFLALLAYDLWTVRMGLVPAWYASLRWQLTIAVVALLGVALVGATPP